MNADADVNVNMNGNVNLNESVHVDCWLLPLILVSFCYVLSLMHDYFSCALCSKALRKNAMRFSVAGCFKRFSVSQHEIFGFIFLWMLKASYFSLVITAFKAFFSVQCTT